MLLFFFFFGSSAAVSKRDLSVVDPVVGESSSWISTTAVFRAITAREM